MGKAKNPEADTLRRELLQAGLYKRSQGRVARQVTFAALGVSIALGTYRMWQTLENGTLLRTMLGWVGMTGSAPTMAWVLPLVLFAGGLWLSYRIVNWPKFADFLIAVEAEMNKVSWPNRSELYRSSLVVIFTIVFLGAVLFLFDWIWTWFFQQIGIR